MIVLGHRRRSVCSLLLLAGLLVGCHFETRAPSGSGGDEAAVQGDVANFYRALAQHDTTALDTLTYGAATVLLSAGHAEPSLIPWRTMTSLPERRTAKSGIRLVRSEVRLDGDFASVRAVIAAREATAGGEYEAADVLTFARREHRWRIAHILFGPWRLRTAP